MRSAIRWALVATILGSAAGCGGGGVTPTGKVTHGGADFKPAEGEGVTVNLTSEDGHSNGSGTVGPDGTFTIKSTDGAGLKPGKYKVGIVHYFPSSAAKKGGSPPAPKNMSAGETWDVASGQTYTIDLAKYK